MEWVVDYGSGKLDKIMCSSLEAAEAMVKDLVDLKLAEKCKITKVG
jgi:hypothetical protein